MNILLIGHRGYLGSGLQRYFEAQGHAVTGRDLPQSLLSMVGAHVDGHDVVVNLAVFADRGAGRYNCHSTGHRVNVTGATRLAGLLWETRIPWIQLSTREVFGPVYGQDDVWVTPHGFRPKFLVDESQPFAPVNPYGKSKVMAEWIAESHPQSAVIRLTTCYTDEDHPTGNWVPSLIRQIAKGEPVKLTRAGNQFRDPLHVDDLGKLIEKIVEKKAYGETYHAGGGAANLLSLKEFVRLVDPKVEIQSVSGGDYGFAFDNRKAEKLGWFPSILVKDRVAVIRQNAIKAAA